MLLSAPVARIQVLPETLSNQIAAGEVIERPAAVVKELVENSLDAGAARIEIALLDGGRKLVRVTDDGSGMSREDAALSLQRHATSKLRTKDDLFAVRSYGFRGEALPSMAAVSRFSLLTCERGASHGTRIEVEGGRAGEPRDAGAPPGTTVEVHDLFWNVPARRKFLKRAQAEQAQCIDAVLRLALPRPDVTFVVREGERPIAQLQSGPQDAVLPARAAEALGREVRGHLHEVRSETRGLKLRGLAVAPQVDFGSARNVWLFVNGRAIRDRSLTHAVLRAYGEVLPHGRFPGAILFLEVPLAEVDVNVHPAKAEVRLADPRAAWDAVQMALQPLLRHEPRVAESHAAYGSHQPELLPQAKSLRYLGQLHASYLVCESEQGLVLVDQHAAHERINYQRLRAAARGPVQPMLVPQVVELSAADAARIAGARETLRSLGIEIEHFGENSVAVKALPPPLQGGLLGPLLADLAEGLTRVDDDLFKRAACHASVRAHDALTPQEAQALLDALDQTDYGARCAHGRPVVAAFSTAEIERRFGRDYAPHSHAAPKEIL
ncbi:MAG TPA: DNA mismatch repair endonuclease MutL [Myxococcales bacterium]|nr:DNA mismatch repair endonuclease MutL [Myxococcales bacterium]